MRGVLIMPVPPFIWRSLGITRRRILPLFLTAEWSHVEVTPSAAHRFVAAIVDEVGAKDELAVAEEHVVTVPFVHAEVGMEAVGDGLPRHLPIHSRFQAGDVRLRSARGERESGVAGVQVRKVGNLNTAKG